MSCRTLSVPLLFVTLLACNKKDGETTPDSTATGDAVAPGVWALDGLDEDLPNDDLAPFFDAVGDAQFVGLGETIHTSGGYQQAKFRLVKALVEEHGFRAVGYESPWDALLVAQEYVRTCSGSVDDAVGEYIWLWEDQALEDMLEWMCAWNQEHPDDPVTMWGWDIQQPWHDGPRLDAYFAEAAPADAAALSAGISTCLGVDRGDVDSFTLSSDVNEVLTGVDEAEHAACLAGLAAVEAYFDTNEAQLVAATSEDELAWARISLVGLEGWQIEVYYHSGNSYECALGYEARDVANAYVLQEIHRLTMPDTKSVIWAHNHHLGFDTASLTGRYGEADWDANVGGCAPWVGMGTHLQAALGDAYRPFALTGYDVHISWDGWDEPMVVPYDRFASEKLLHDLGVGDAFVDLQVEDSFFEDRKYELGGVWAVLRDQYAGVIFLDSSWAMELPYEDPFNAGCAADEVRIEGTARPANAIGFGTSICVLDGPCTTAEAAGKYELCVPANTNAALTFAFEGHSSQTVLISPWDRALFKVDAGMGSDDFNVGFYEAAGVVYPPAPGTGNALGWVADANFELLVGATISISPVSGVGVVYLDENDVPYVPQTGTGESWFMLGELAAGWYDVTIEHPDANQCRLISGNYTSEGTTLHVPIVDGAEVTLEIQCTP